MFDDDRFVKYDNPLYNANAVAMLVVSAWKPYQAPIVVTLHTNVYDYGISSDHVNSVLNIDIHIYIYIYSCLPMLAALDLSGLQYIEELTVVYTNHFETMMLMRFSRSTGYCCRPSRILQLIKKNVLTQAAICQLMLFAWTLSFSSIIPSIYCLYYTIFLFIFFSQYTLPL